MKTLIFAKRNMKEISRDLLSLFFGVALPNLLFFLLKQKNSDKREKYSI